MKIKGLDMSKKLLDLNATHEEALFAAQSIVKGYNDVVSQCAYLDATIANFTKQRLELQPSLEAATSLARKVEAVLPTPPIEEPPVVSQPIELPPEGAPV